VSAIAPPPSRSAVRPVDAASLVVVDRSGPQPRLLMGTRHAGHRFMPGHLVFPGGRVDPSDRTMRAYGALPAHVERRLLDRAPRSTASRARALALCAIRETFEETGIMIGEAGLGAPQAPASWSAFAQRQVYPALENLHFLARAITPPWSPRRFDTRFFIVDASSVAARVTGVVGPEAELVDMAWLTCGEARQRNIADITAFILDDVAERLEAGLERDVPVPFYFERSGRRRREAI
jgi:8-oxo-dGTP pyrophosphatase MutT (NUDIX family)